MPELTQTELLSLARNYFHKRLVEENDRLFLIDDIWQSTSADRAVWSAHAEHQAESLCTLHRQGKAASLFSGAIDALLNERGFKGVGLESRALLDDYAVRAEIESRRVFRAKLNQDYPATDPQDPIFKGILVDTLSPLPGQASSQAKEAFVLEDLVLKFKEARQKTWAYKTQLDYSRVLGWFLVHSGAKTPVRQVSTTDIGNFRDVLLKIPKAYGRKKADKGLSLETAIAQKAGEPTLSPKTAEKYLNFTRSFLNWCEDEGYIDKVPGQKIGISYKTEQKPRLPFDQDQLERLFSSPLWTGCHSLSRRSRSGPNVYRNAYYWLPLVALYTGMRCGEIVQLRHQDIRYAEGIAYFDVNDDHQKKLKTKYSRRRIPVHPCLLKWGFLELVNSGSDPHERIFKEIKINKHDDPSHAYSKAFARYLKDVGLKTDQLTFHSFRHTFSDALDNVSSTEAQKKTMMGHSDQSASAHYGSGVSMSLLFETMRRIEYNFESSFDVPCALKAGSATWD